MPLSQEEHLRRATAVDEKQSYGTRGGRERSRERVTVAQSRIVTVNSRFGTTYACKGCEAANLLPVRK